MSVFDGIRNPENEEINYTENHFDENGYFKLIVKKEYERGPGITPERLIEQHFKNSYDDFCFWLSRKFNGAIVSTSANISGLFVLLSSTLPLNSLYDCCWFGISCCTAA